jgi:hypothetical protein
MKIKQQLVSSASISMLSAACLIQSLQEASSWKFEMNGHLYVPWYLSKQGAIGDSSYLSIQSTS